MFEPGCNVTAVIAEDEPLLAAELAETLALLWPQLRVVEVVGDGVRALEAIERLSPSVVFLDIEMPKLGGLDVARAIDGRAHVVFVTAYDQHAIAAFDAGAVDYVLKPIQTARLSACIRRLKGRTGSAPVAIDSVLRRLAGQTPAPRRPLQWISAARGTGLRMILVEDVCYFKADHKVTLVIEASGESLIRKTIRELSDELDGALFWQIHRSTVVNVAAIESVVRDDRGGLQLKLKLRPERLAVSESYQSLFRQM